MLFERSTAEMGPFPTGSVLSGGSMCRWEAGDERSNGIEVLAGFKVTVDEMLGG